MRRIPYALALIALFVLCLPVLYLAAGGATPAALSPEAAIGGSCTVLAGGIADPGPASGTIELDPGQVNNARIIATVARGRGLPERAAAIALMTAMQESTLTNVSHGDMIGPTSRGLFQQKPEFYPGVDVLEPEGAAKAFYDRLVAVPGYLVKAMWVAAQAVQRSADGTLYDRWSDFGQTLARSFYGGVAGGVRCTGGHMEAGPPQPVDDRIAVVLKAARSQLGAWYVWAGGNSAGPTTGSGRPCTAGPDAYGCGFDCSGLTLYTWARAGVNLPHSSRAQYSSGLKVPLDRAETGDLIFLATDTKNPATIHHVAMISGPGEIIEAQTAGVPVHIRPFRGRREPEIMPFAVRLVGSAVR